jgi:hypothetical protein
MAWYSGAQKHALTRHFKQGMMVHPVRGLVLHITTGKPNLAGQWGDFNSPNQTGRLRSAHFLVDKDGTMWQLIDTDDVAFAVDGVYGGEGVDNHWISVENIADTGEALTDEQIDSCAEIFGWLHRTDNVPLSLANKKGEFGLGYHRIWSGMAHPCPGDLVIAQRNAILEVCSAAYS